MTEYVSLTLHSKSTDNPFFTLSVPKDWLELYIQPSDAFSLLIRGEDLFEWYDITNFPGDQELSWPTFQLLNQTLTISPTSLVLRGEEVDGRIKPTLMNEVVHFIASVLLKLDRKKSNDAEYHANIISGIVRFTTKEGFLKANSSHPAQSDNVFSMKDSKVKEWQRTLWPAEHVDLAGISFGANDLELELLSPLNQSGTSKKGRRRVSLLQIEKETNTQLWALSSCGENKFKDTEQEIVTAQNEIDYYRDKTDVELNGSLIKTMERPALGQDNKAAVFYLRYLDEEEAKKGIQTLMQPSFALHFGGDVNENIWAPRWLQHTDHTDHADHTDEKLIFTDHELLTLNDDGTFKLHGDLFKNNSSDDSPNNTTADVPVIHWEDKQLVNVNNIPELKCVGVAGVDLQDDYLWQYGKITPKPPVLKEGMHGWTRFRIPDTNDTKPLPSGNVLRIASGNDNRDWRFDFGSDITDPNAESLTLRLTITTAEQSLKMEILDGLFAVYSPEFYAWTRRLQDPSAPPNTKELAEGLRKARLVFATLLAPKHNEQSSSDEQIDSDDYSFHTDLPSIFINNVSKEQKPEFRMICLNQAVVTYAPFIEDAGIDFVSPGSSNLVQTKDKQTLRTIVERDTTHGLVPFEIKKCQLTNNGITTRLDGSVEENNYVELLPNISAAMALAPWVQMSDQIKNKDEEAGKIKKQRKLFHRNLVLEHGELATASIDRSIDGTPNALVGSVKEFIQSVRDDYAPAADFKGDGKEAAEIINWLPGVEISNGDAPSARIEYPLKEGITDLDDRTPVVKCRMPDGTEQELRIAADETADDEQQDWLTCDVRLKKVDESEDNLVPHVAISSADFEDTEFESGSSRARNGSVPLLFDGADFVSCCGDSRSNMDKQDEPLSWFVAEQEGGSLSIVDRRSGQKLETLPAEDDQTALAIGTGQSGDKDWIVRVTKRGEIQVWSQDKKTKWHDVKPAPETIGSAEISELDEAAISATEELVSILVADTNAGKVHLLFWSPSDDSEVVPVLVSLPDDDPFNFNNAQHWDILLYDQDSIFLAASVPGGSTFVLRGLRTDGDWTFFRLPLRDADTPKSPLTSPASVVSLTRYRDCAAVATLSESGKHWSLGVITMDDVVQLDSVSLPEKAVNICLQNRRDGIAGLPVGCRSLWICVANTSGSIDVWLSTSEANLRSIQTELAAELEDYSRQPYYRLEGHFGDIHSLSPCFLDNHYCGLVSCGSDGMARLWNLDAMRLVCSYRDSHWMLDNLGTLRSTAKQTADAGLVMMTDVSYPKDPSAARGTETALHEAKGSTVTISYVPDDASPLVQVNNDDHPDTITEICFSCEGLRLKNSSGNSWVPERVEEEPPEDAKSSEFLLTSRGYFGVFGFFSTIPGKTGATSYLPRIGGVPVFIHEIVEITIKNKKITGMVLNGVLINPLLLDGTYSTNAHDLKGDLPAPIAQALAEQSLIQIKLTTGDDDRLYIDPDPEKKGITSKNNKNGDITWNMLAADSVSDSSESGFDGQLESLTFTVSYDGRILLNVSPEKSRVRMLGGSHAVMLPEHPVILAGYGYNINQEGLEKKYGFETLWDYLPSHPEQSPIMSIKKADHTFSDPPLPEESIDGIEPLCWWEMLTREQQTAMGRITVPKLILPNSNERFRLGVADLDFDTETKKDTRLSSVSHNAYVTTSCLVSDNRTSYLATGDEAGEVRIWDALSGRKLRQFSIGSGAVTALTGITHQGQAYVAAVIDGRGYVFDVAEEILFDLPIPTDKVRLLTGIDMCSSGESLFAGAAGSEEIDKDTTEWKALLWNCLCGNLNDPLLVNKDQLDLAINSVTLGFMNDELRFFVAADKKIYSYICTYKPDTKPLSAILDSNFVHDAPGTNITLKFFSHDLETGYLVAAAPGMNLYSFEFKADVPPDKPRIHTAKVPSWSTLDIQIVHAAEQDSRTITSKAFVGPGQGVVAKESGSGTDWSIKEFNLLRPVEGRIFTPGFVDQQPVPFAVGSVWSSHPHIASADDEGNVHIIDLHPERRVRMSIHDVKVNQVEFAEHYADGSTVLVGFSEQSVFIWHPTNWVKNTLLKTEGKIHTGAVAHNFVLIADEQTTNNYVLVADDKQTIMMPISSKDNTDKIIINNNNQGGKKVDFAAFDFESNTQAIAVLKFKDNAACHLYEINVSEKEAEELNKVDLPGSVIPKKLVSLGGRRHLLMENEEKSTVGLWSLYGNSMFHRWRFNTGEFHHSTVLKTQRGIQILTASSGKVDVWSDEGLGLIQFDETGKVRAASRVDFEISQEKDPDLDIRARICLDGSVAFTNKDKPMLAALYRQGLYAFLLNPLAETSAAEGILTLWREVGTEGAVLAGNVTKATRKQRKITVSIAVKGEKSISLNEDSANFNWIELRSRLFGSAEKNRQETVLSGVLTLNLQEGQTGTIFFSDQLITFENGIVEENTTYNITGFLNLKTENGIFQGPLRCQCGFKAGELSKVNLLPDIYRTIKQDQFDGKSSSNDDDLIRCDAAFGEHTLNLVTADTSNAASEVFIQLKGEKETIKVLEIPAELVPVDTCMDNEALQPFGIAPSNITRLSHLQGLGTRLRFASVGEETNTTLSATEEFKGDGDPTTIRVIQPVLFNQSGVRILDAGIVAAGNETETGRFVTESILSVARPPEETGKQKSILRSLINCLTSSSAETDQAVLFDSRDFSQYSLNRWILVRYAVRSTSADFPVLSLLEGQETAARESFYLSANTANNNNNDDAPPETTPPDLRRLTHTEARQWRYSSEHQYAVQPDTPSPERDLDRTAWREISIGRAGTVPQQINQEDESGESIAPPATQDEQQRAILLQEATAFHRMPRQWFLPQTSWKDTRFIRAKVEITENDQDIAEQLVDINDEAAKTQKKNRLIRQKRDKLVYQFQNDSRVDELLFIAEEYTAELKKWTLAGYDDAGIFTTVSLRDTDSQQTELLKKLNNGAKNEKIIKLARPILNQNTFHPSSLRVRLAPDKPGAMMHHRFQFISTDQQRSEPNNPKFHLGSSVDFSLREPMQLNPPIGSSIEWIELVGTEKYPKIEKSDFGANISFAWKETLGTIPITTEGTAMTISQLQSQRSEGVPPEDVQLEIDSGSQNCLQLIVQINDQLINLDERQPLFPVYDARQAAKTRQEIELGDGIELPELQPSIELIGVRDYKTDNLILAKQNKEEKKKEFEFVAFSLRDLQNPQKITFAQEQDITSAVSTTLTQDIEGFPVILSAFEGKIQAFRIIDGKADSFLENTNSSALDVAAARMTNDAKHFDIFAALEKNKTHFWIPELNADTNKYQYVHTEFPAMPSDSKNKLLLAGTDSNLFFAAYWSDNNLESKVEIWRVALSSDKKTAEKVTTIKPKKIQAVALHSAHVGNSYEPLLFIAEDDGYVRSYDQSGKVTREISVPHPVKSMDLNVELDNLLLTISTGTIDDPEKDTHRVVVIDIEREQILREVTKAAHGGNLVVLGGRPTLVCLDKDNRIHFSETYLSSIKPPNIFLSSELKNLYQKVTVDNVKITLEKEGDDKKIVYATVVLTPMLVLELRGSTPANPIESEIPIKRNLFKPIYTEEERENELNGYQLYHFDTDNKEDDPKKILNNLKLDQTKSIRISWRGKFTTGVEEEASSEQPPIDLSTYLDPVEAVYGGASGKRKLRLVPYAATAAKCCAVLTVDDKDNNEIMQRNLLFGDAANASFGKGVLRSQRSDEDTPPKPPLFAFEIEEQEATETALPENSTTDHQIGLILVKYFADGQTLRTRHKELELKKVEEKKKETA
ncbi:MAG: hypothetical protein SD837_10335 [Candidatus Electrothrix scaldis]|nr:MAG: hypothetical protein SD837_10335 [Candidatus Electrothrix sp. GW3-3]